MARGLARPWVFALLGLLYGSLPATAQTFYVRAGAAGAGGDWTHALPALPATLVRGATYYVAAGVYGGYTFDDAPHGSVAITIRKATATDHGTDVGWQAGYAGQAIFRGTLRFTADDYVLDGASRNADWRSGYGFKVDVSQLGGAYGITMGLPFQSAVQRISVRHVEVQGTGSDPDINAPDPINDRGITASCSATCVGSSDIYVGYSYVHDQGESSLHMFRTQRLTVEYSVIARNNSTAEHHAGGLIANEGVNGLTFRHNVMEDIEGTAYIETPTGGHPGCGGTIQRDWYIYGNVFVSTPSSSRATGNGVFYVFDHRHLGDLVFVNNSMVNLPNGFVGLEASPTSAGCAERMTVQNNLWYASRSTVGRTANVAQLTWSHNAYFATATADPDASRYVNAGDPFVDWRAGHFHLATGTPPGVRLPAPFDADLAGRPRGGDGVWDRGAFEWDGASPPAAPALRVSMNQATFTSSDLLVATVDAVAGVAPSAVDAYVVVQLPQGGYLSLQLNGSLVPGLVPIARGVVVPTVSLPFTFPLARASPGSYAWLAAVTVPGTLQAVGAIVRTPFAIVP